MSTTSTPPCSHSVLLYEVSLCADRSQEAPAQAAGLLRSLRHGVHERQPAQDCVLHLLLGAPADCHGDGPQVRVGPRHPRPLQERLPGAPLTLPPRLAGARPMTHISITADDVLAQPAASHNPAAPLMICMCVMKAVQYQHRHARGNIVQGHRCAAAQRRGLSKLCSLHRSGCAWLQMCITICREPRS